MLAVAAIVACVKEIVRTRPYPQKHRYSIFFPTLSKNFDFFQKKIKIRCSLFDFFGLYK